MPYFDRCARCGRPLSGRISTLTGYGDCCRRSVHRAAAVLMDSGEKMPYKAALALMDAAAMPIKPGKVWAVVSDDGKSLYLASPHNCTCKGAMYRPVQFSCYHQWVAAILARYDFPKPRLFVSDLKA